MHATPIRLGAEVEFVLRERFPKLDQHRIELVGNYIEASTCHGLVETPDTLLILQGHAPTIDEGHGVNHIFFTPEEGRKVRNYQLVHPTLPWPKPIVTTDLTPRGINMGPLQERVPIQLVRAGSIQLWWGDGIGEIWEAVLENPNLPADQTELLHGVWDALERALKDRGCQHVYTLARDPRYPTDYYENFLRERGYEPSAAHQKKTELAWVKPLNRETA